MEFGYVEIDFRGDRPAPLKTMEATKEPFTFSSKKLRLTDIVFSLAKNAYMMDIQSHLIVF